MGLGGGGVEGSGCLSSNEPWLWEKEEGRVGWEKRGGWQEMKGGNRASQHLHCAGITLSGVLMRLSLLLCRNSKYCWSLISSFFVCPCAVDWLVMEISRRRHTGDKWTAAGKVHAFVGESVPLLAGMGEFICFCRWLIKRVHVCVCVCMDTLPLPCTCPKIIMLTTDTHTHTPTSPCWGVYMSWEWRLPLQPGGKESHAKPIKLTYTHTHIHSCKKKITRILTLKRIHCLHFRKITDMIPT